MRYKKRTGESRTFKQKNQKEVPVGRILVVVVVGLLGLAFVFQFMSMQQRLNAIEEKGVGKAVEVKSVQGGGADLQALKGKIEEL